jgi:hypothetical protein
MFNMNSFMSFFQKWLSAIRWKIESKVLKVHEEQLFCASNKSVFSWEANRRREFD